MTPFWNVQVKHAQWMLFSKISQEWFYYWQLRTAASVWNACIGHLSFSRKWRPLDCTGRFAQQGMLPLAQMMFFFFNPGLPVLEVIQGVWSIQPKFRPIWQGKVVHLKRWTSFFETFPVAPNWPIEFCTKISRHFGWMDRTQGSGVRPQKWITHGRL